jgi:ribonuclease D
MQTLYIDNPQALADFCAQMKASPWIAVDTEFMREKTYYGQLCLVQVATPGQIACIDPIQCPQLEALYELLFNPDITKVIHAAGQDLQLLFEMTGKVPAPVFDTQIAATLLGHGHQIGYGALVKQILNVELDKSHSRTDWSRRPLSQEQIDYAADDVRYLAQMYPLIVDKLETSGRLQWLDSDFEQLVARENYEASADRLWQRISGVNKLKGVQLAALRELVGWREQRARKSNIPRKWVLADDVLITMAMQMPAKRDKLSRIRGISGDMLKRHGDNLLALLEQARQMPRDEWPQFKRPPRLDDEQEARVDLMMALVRYRCHANGISPAMVTNRKELDQLVTGERDLNVLKGWRQHIVGNELLALLQGQRILYIDGDNIVIEHKN